MPQDKPLKILLVDDEPLALEALRALLAMTALALAVWLYRIPSRDGPGAPR